MSCCGKQRQQFFGTLPVPPRAEARRPQPAVRFEYVGTTGLTVLGPVTGAQYRFGNPGAQVLVDSRDALSISAVPYLRRI
jgi:hypothetical protein